MVKYSGANRLKLNRKRGRSMQITNSQLSTTEPKTKAKRTKQMTRTGTESQK